MNLLQEVLQQVKEVKQESEYLLKLKELTWVEKLNQAEAAAAAEISKLRAAAKVFVSSLASGSSYITAMLRNRKLAMAFSSIGRGGGAGTRTTKEVPSGIIDLATDIKNAGTVGTGNNRGTHCSGTEVHELAAEFRANEKSAPKVRCL